MCTHRLSWWAFSWIEMWRWQSVCRLHLRMKCQVCNLFMYTKTPSIIYKIWPVTRIFRRMATWMSDVHACMCKRGRTGGSGGKLPQEISWKIDTLRLVMAIFGQKQSCSSYTAHRVLHSVLHSIFGSSYMCLLIHSTSKFHEKVVEQQVGWQMVKKVCREYWQ